AVRARGDLGRRARVQQRVRSGWFADAVGGGARDLERRDGRDLDRAADEGARGALDHRRRLQHRAQLRSDPAVRDGRRRRRDCGRVHPARWALLPGGSAPLPDALRAGEGPLSGRARHCDRRAGSPPARADRSRGSGQGSGGSGVPAPASRYGRGDSGGDRAAPGSPPRHAPPTAGPGVSSARPLVSVIMPTYNGEDFVAETIESVLSQTYEPIELVVVDDASNDDTPDI